MQSEYTKEELLEIIEKSIIPYEKWNDRDTPKSLSQIATAAIYLKCGCKFRMSEVKGLISDEETIWIEIFHYEFENDPTWHIYYLPTLKRLEDKKGLDWY